MSVTLEQIWSAPPKEIQRVLREAKRESSGHLNRDRATVAILYHSHQQLAPEDEKWVPWLGSVETLSSASSLKEKLKNLERSFVDLLLTTYYSLYLNSAYRNTNMFGSLDRALRTIIKPISNIAAAKAYSENPSLRMIGREAIGAASLDRVSVPAGATQAEIDNARTKGYWRVTLSHQHEMQNVMSSVPLDLKDFDPIQIINNLLSTSLRGATPIRLCYYLYMISKMIQIIPPNEDLSTRLAKISAKYGCSEIFAELPAEPLTEKGLSPLTSKVGEEAENALRALIGGLVGRPPTEEEVIQRLLQL